MMYIVAALILLAQLIQKEEDKEPLTAPRETATDDSFRAPGFEERKSPTTFVEDVP
jgi:hypothetical protein